MLKYNTKCIVHDYSSSVIVHSHKLSPCKEEIRTFSYKIRLLLPPRRAESYYFQVDIWSFPDAFHYFCNILFMIDHACVLFVLICHNLSIYIILLWWLGFLIFVVTFLLTVNEFFYYFFTLKYCRLFFFIHGEALFQSYIEWIVFIIDEAEKGSMVLWNLYNPNRWHVWMLYSLDSPCFIFHSL